MALKRMKPTPAMIIALVALAVAIGGTAVAANKIGTNQIKNNAVTKKKIKKKAVSTNRLAAKAVTNGKIGPEAVKSGKLAGEAVTGSKLADGAVDNSKIADSAVDGLKVADDSLDDSKLSDYKVLGNSFLQVPATNGPNNNLARLAAPEQPLLTKGPLEIYAKCFRNTGTDTTWGEIYVRTTTDFSIMEGDFDLPGGPAASDYLNTNTAEADRRLASADVTGNQAVLVEGEGVAGAADGTALNVLTAIGAKNGSVFADGPYGPGNACIFHGAAMG